MINVASFLKVMFSQNANNPGTVRVGVQLKAQEAQGFTFEKTVVLLKVFR